MNGQGLNSSALKKSWGCSLAGGSPGLQDEYSPCLNERHGMGSCELPTSVVEQLINSARIIEIGYL